MTTLTKAEISGEIRRMQRVLDHLQKVSPASRRWLLDRLVEMVALDQEGTEWEVQRRR